MSAADILQNMLIEEEGFRAYVYDDANGKAIGPGYTCIGHPTVGYGLALDTCGITKDEAAALLAPRRDNALAQLGKSFGWFPTLSPERQAALGCMVYQMGFGGFLKFANMITALSTGDFARARAEMLDSVWAKQTPNRAKRLANIISPEV